MLKYCSCRFGTIKEILKKPLKVSPARLKLGAFFIQKIMVKLTKRKGFNFFRSYYDVYNELETDSDKVAFIDALLDRQFLGIKPTNLKGMSKFAYISQTNSIDSQVKGYEDKTKTILHPTLGGTVGGSVGGNLPPTIQVQEEVQVQVKETNNIDSRKLKFANTLKPFIDIYGRDLIKDFYGYWTEPNKSNTKFKQELQKTWDTKRRLENWAKNDINFNKNKNGKSNITDSEQFKELTKSIRSTGDRI